MLALVKFSCLTILRIQELVFCFSAISIHGTYPANYQFFYKECLEDQSDFNGHHDIIATKQDILNEIIWNNQNLLINKQSIYSKRIKEAGFVKLGHILPNDSKLKSHN